MALSMRPASRMPVSKKGKKKSDEAQNVLDRLEAFLDEKVPGLVKQLASFWALQAAAVTHKQLRSFVAEEDSPDSLIPDWRHDYAVLAAGKMADGWREALTAGMRAGTPESGSAQGHEDIDTRQGTDARSAGPAESGTLFPDLLTPVGQATSQPHVPTGGAGTLLTPTPIPPSGGSTVIYSPTDEKIRNWINTRAGELITNSTNEQVEAIRHILMESKANQMSVEETARLIRPTIGLTRPQAASNLKYYNSVKESLRKEHPRMKEESIEKKAREAAEKYAQKQIRYRAQLIAETELAFAYNYGHHEAIREGMASGKLPLMREIWSTANNGHVCESCQDLEGMEVGFDEEFSVEVHSKRNPERVLRTLKTTVPPLHPRCHCALLYVESTAGAGTADQAPDTDSVLQAPGFGELDDGQLLRSGDLREALGDEDFAEYSRIIATNPYEEIKTLYYNYGFDATEYHHYERGGGYYPVWDEVHFSYPTHPERHKYEILAHEDGHKMDHKIDGSLNDLTFDGITKLDNALLGWLKTQDQYIRPSQSDRFLSAIRADKAAIETMRKKDPVTWDGIIYALREHDYTIGAQDFLAGLYGRYDLGLIWGHGDEYYDRIYHIARDKVGIGLVRQRLSDQGIETTGPQSLRKLCREYVTGTELWANIQSAVVLRNESPGALGALKVLAPESVKAYLEITGMVLR